MKLSQLFLATALLCVVNAQFKFIGGNSIDSWSKMSPAENNDWKAKNKVGAILGFSVFGTAFLYAIVKIFIDINERDKMYDNEIEEDLK